LTPPNDAGVLRFQVARAFKPLIAPARYKGAWGGRGSGKSHYFAERLVRAAIKTPGFRAVCIREVQKDLNQSAKRLIEDKIQTHGVGHLFDCQKAVTVTPGGGVIVYQGMQDHTADSVKSLEGFDVAWVEEAQTLSPRSLTLLRPTIRKPGSELWFSWNPRRKNDPVDMMLRGEDRPTGAVVVRANWSDNPWFPAELEQERQDDQRMKPDQYEHIWEGGYEAITEGAYYAACLTQAKAQGRLGEISADPLMAYRAFWDIGGTGAKADATTIWVCQFIGEKIKVLAYYEAQGQDLATHINWLRSSGYGAAECFLPHDGAAHDKVFDASYEGALRAAGFSVTVVPNQGRGAASKRIEAARRWFPRMWFNRATCQPGLDALGAYHEKRDDSRGLGLGPNHDWSSHGADSFGLMASTYSEPRSLAPIKRNIKGVS
jgi:phage terminase large subunit